MEQSGFDVSVTLQGLGALCRDAAGAVPLRGRVRIKRMWAGLRPGTPDELPILGPVEGLDGYYNAAGGFRTGIVAAPLMGQVVAQWITGERLAFPCEAFRMEGFVALGSARARGSDSSAAAP
jgi:hydrogen cyanide synthase HcnC